MDTPKAHRFPVSILITNIDIEPEVVEAAERATRYAKNVCLVSLALDTLVHLEVHVEAGEIAAVT